MLSSGFQATESLYSKLEQIASEWGKHHIYVYASLKSIN